MGVILLLLGVAGMIINANHWFIIPNAAIIVVMGIGVIMCLWKVAITNQIRNDINDIRRKF